MVFMQWRKQICLKIEMVESEIECVPCPLSCDHVCVIHYHVINLISLNIIVHSNFFPQSILSPCLKFLKSSLMSMLLSSTNSRCYLHPVSQLQFQFQI